MNILDVPSGATVGLFVPHHGSFRASSGDLQLEMLTQHFPYWNVPIIATQV